MLTPGEFVEINTKGYQLWRMMAYAEKHGVSLPMSEDAKVFRAEWDHIVDLYENRTLWEKFKGIFEC